LANFTDSIDSGANASVMPIFNTASLVGFGAVIASLPAFDAIASGVLSLGGENPLVSLSLSVSVLAGITGSASGGMSIVLQAMGAKFGEMALASGISLELMHRVTALAAGGLDCLPHGGAVITLLQICNLNHRDSYLDIFAVSVAGPIIALVAVIILGTLFGSF
jgi:H+/gluconate symporter-like permease